MKWTVRGYAHGVSIAVLTGALVLSSEMPLLATPPQSAQSSPSTQKQDGSLPDAPQLQPVPQDEQQAPLPSGTAGAKAATVKGAPVAKPAGAAVAPVRQRGHRSLIIKLGLLAGAGIAVGTAVALSEGSPSRPPGTASSAR
ncbi:MAG: hypothetical protein ACLQLC_07925 [Candidatus Sulfotelmatobacter sp.]